MKTLLIVVGLAIAANTVKAESFETWLHRWEMEEAAQKQNELLQEQLDTIQEQQSTLDDINQKLDDLEQSN